MVTGNVFAIISLIIYMFFIGVGIYCLVLLILFLQKGIRAFDIYIRKNGGL